MCVFILQADFLTSLIRSIQQLILDPMNFTTRGDVNRVIFTLNTFKHAVQHSGQGGNADVNSKSRGKCQCMQGYHISQGRSSKYINLKIT